MTLVEVIVALVILAISVIGILSALTVLAASSFTVNLRANVGAALRSAVEDVKSASYIACTSTNPTPMASYQAAAAQASLPTLNGQPDVKTPQVLAVNAPTGGPLAGCTQDPGLQVVEVSDWSTNGQVHETLWVVKRNGS